MAPPGNGIFVVRGEMSTLMTAMRRGARWGSTSYQEEEQDGLMKQFIDLKQVLIKIEDLRLIDPNAFLAPFLDIIRSEETTGPITSLALSAVNKFLSYGLIDPTHSALAATVENIADAVTHARFVGTDQASDAVVLMKIVQVLRTLMLSPEGSALTNESVCEVMLSCFRICFEPRLNELLRRTAEHALRDMVLILFMRLPQFAKEPTGFVRKLKMIAGSMEQSNKKRKTKVKPMNQDAVKSLTKIAEIKINDAEEPVSPTLLTAPQLLKAPPLATTPATPVMGNIVDMQGKITQTPTSSMIAVDTTVQAEKLSSEIEGTEVADEKPLLREDSVEFDEEDEDTAAKVLVDEDDKEDYVNSVGVRFTQQDGSAPLIPYGLPCIQELFRFLVSLCNPMDKQNTDTMMHMGLSLLTVALEVGADSIGRYDSLLTLVKDEMCRHLFALLNTERVTIFAADLQVCFLLFESLRLHLKFHLEFYLTKLTEIIASENPRTPYETRELALDNMLQLWRIPGFAAEVYINYDCDLYCTNLFEDLVKLLSKNALSATQAIYSTHILSLDALLTIIANIEQNCAASKEGIQFQPGRHSRNNSSTDQIILEQDDDVKIQNISHFMSQAGQKIHNERTITHEQLLELKNKKRILTQGTELFNQRPEKGIQYLQDHGILNSKLDPMEIAHFLRENPGLDKKMIGEYISKKKNVESKILETYVTSFDFSNTRIDEALRQYLETFRLPGEAPLIFLVLEHFADHWHRGNGEPFFNTDAAFRLAYAIIMLNMDQHNTNAKRLNVPMTQDDFIKNLRGLNGSIDYDQEMLAAIYNGIKSDEIVMPAEQTGLVRENYLWKVLLRRGATKDGNFHHVASVQHDKEIFQIVWGPTLAALSFMFDKCTEPSYKKSINGFNKCAAISAHYNLHEDFDALILTLCKFTSLLNVPIDVNDISLCVNFGLNPKAQIAIKTVFGMVHDHGDCMRDSWKNILDLVVQLFKLKLLPKSLMEVEDFCEVNGKVQLVLEKPLPKTDAGLLSSLYSYLSSEGQRQPNYEEQEIIKVTKRCVKECQVDQVIAESKFLQFESLQDLIKCLLSGIKIPSSHKSVGLPYAEDTSVFLMEVMVRILIQNRDRLLQLWPACRDHMYLLLIGGATNGYDYLLIRTTVALLKLAIYLMRNEELCPVVLQSLKMFLLLKPSVIFKISKQISVGIYELLKTSAQNIHTEQDWAIVFTILECVGAGSIPPEFEDVPVLGTKSDGALSSEEDSGIPDRGYISDSEVAVKSGQTSSSSGTPYISANGENWILVNKDADITSSMPTSPINTLTYHCRLLDHSSFALVKCWDSLAFIVRNVAHITPYNFENCVKCIRTFVEASLNGGVRLKKTKLKNPNRQHVTKNKNKDNESSDSEDDDLMQRYETIAIQLLDLMHTLHTRTAQIFRWWAEEGGAVPQCAALWSQGWCPLLQGIGRLATDKRRQVRTSAITCLQRALLVHDLQTLTGPEWAACFKQVLFPLLFQMLEESTSTLDRSLLEESRMRTATIMSKVFLHHLTPLISLPNFNELWLEILDFLHRFMTADSDMLYEAILESLKNMLLVMHSVRVFHNNDGTTHSPLWNVTWMKIGEFLPNLKEELFRNEGEQSTQKEISGQPTFVQQVSHPVSVSLNQSPVEQRQPQNTSPISVISDVPIDSHLSSIILQPPIQEISTNSTNLSGLFVQQPQTLPILLPQMPSSPTHYQQQVPFLPQNEICGSQPLFYPVCDQTTETTPISETPSSVELVSPEISPEHACGTRINDHNESDFFNVIELPLSPVVNIDINQQQPPTNMNDNQIAVAQNQDTYEPAVQYKTVDDQSSKLSETEYKRQACLNECEESPRIPISHLLAVNHYPSLSHVPSNIAQSFAPVFVQPSSVQPNADIYSDYVNNPYNLTLDVGAGVGADSCGSPTKSHAKAVDVSDFQLSNYFANSDSGVIPPGSEVLFGGPFT